ncbi:MAG: hypothetical protein PWP64_108 [Candidatus Cloacimonadota bacterium]|nr:hypothetical protein [Candidatus Cloacimonadota bacterium]
MLILLIFSAFVVGSWALVSDYSFASATGTYTEISGGTILLTGVPTEDDPSYNAIPLGFSFVYDAQTYTTVSINENGFLAMGDEVASSYLPSAPALVPVNIKIYNAKGQLVKQLVQETKATGEYSVIWNSTDLNNQAVSTGIYFYKMNAGKYSSTRKMIMMK